VAGLPDGIFSSPKYQFGGSSNGRCWYVLRPFGLFYFHVVYFVAIWSILLTFVIFVAIWYILWSFGIFYGRLYVIFFPFWNVVCTEKNLATLHFGRHVRIHNGAQV
jgi:hypothetical protein